MIRITFANLGMAAGRMAARQGRLRGALQNIVRGAALLVEAGSKRRTPVLTGRLRGSITTRVQPLSATVGPHTNYALFVHEGTRFMRARPFMQWGVQDVIPKIRSFAQAEIRKAI